MMDLLHHEDIDVFFMTETWHDIGTFASDRLRAAAFTVIDCSRHVIPTTIPRLCYESIMVELPSWLLQVLDFVDML